MLGFFSCLLEAFWPESALLGDVQEKCLAWVTLQRAGKLASVSVRLLLSGHSPSNQRESFLKHEKQTFLRIPSVFSNMIRGCPQLLCEQLFPELLGPLTFCFVVPGWNSGSHVLGMCSATKPLPAHPAYL